MKRFATILLLGLVVSAIPVPASAAPECNVVRDNRLCIEIMSIDPARPEFGKDFRVNAKFTGEGQAANASIPTTIQWLANPSSANDTSKVVKTEQITVQADANGRFNVSLLGTFTPLHFTQSGTNRVGVKFTTQSFSTKTVLQEFTFAPAVASANARLEISVGQAPSSTGTNLNYQFTALYFAPNATSPSQDPNITVTWDFGDSSTGNTGYNVNHTYTSGGQYRVSAVAKNQSGATVATASSKTITVTATGEGGSLFGALDAPTGALISTVNIILGAVLGIVRAITYWLTSYILLPLLEATLKLDAGDIASAPILAGWTYVRDIVNMFFILALIIIAFGTMLKLESYNYKKLLTRLILMALLVNFSLVIARIIIQVLDVVQFTFLPQTVQVEGGTVDGISGVKYIFQSLVTGHSDFLVAGFKNFSLDTTNALASLGTLLFQFTLELMVFVTFGALSIFMIIRTTALWMLLILSPLAYGLAIIPATAEYAKKWWTTFVKYALFAPIMAFFLRLSLAMYRDGLKIIPGAGTNDDIFTYLNKLTANGNRDVDFSQFIVLMIVYVMILAFLWAAMLVTKQMGIFGADAITSMAEKGIKAPFAAGKFLGKEGLGLAGRAYSRALTRGLEKAEKSGKTGRAKLFKFAQFLNPRVAKEAWQARAHEKELEAYQPAVGYARDTLNRVMPTEWHDWKNLRKGKLPKLGQKTYYGRLAQAAMIAHKRSEWEKMPLSEEEKVQSFLEAHHPEDIESLSYVMQDGRHEDGAMIAYKNLHRQENIEKLASHYLARKRDKDGNAIASEAEARTAAKRDYESYYDAVEYTDILTHMYEHAGLSKEQIAERLAHLQEHAEAETKERGLGYAVWDDKFKRFVAANDMSIYQLHEKESRDEFLNELKKAGVFEETTNAAGGRILRFHIKDELDNNTGEYYDISSYAEFEQAMQDTEKKYGSVYDHNRQADLKYELAGARKQMDAQKRKERGNTERWAGSIEPAADTVQYESGFKGFTSYGRRSVPMRPTGIAVSLGRTRVIQGRAIKRLGLNKDESGHFNLDPKSAANPEGTDYSMMAKMFKMNWNEANNLLGRAGLTRKQLEQIRVILEKDYPKYVNHINLHNTAGKDPDGIRDATDSSGAVFSIEQSSAVSSSGATTSGSSGAGGGPTIVVPPTTGGGARPGSRVTFP